MEKKHISLVLIISIIIIVYLYTSKIQKDNWVNEVSEVKYSEKKEKEVWGSVLRANDPELYYGTPLYDLAKALSGILNFKNNEDMEKLIDEIPEEYINFQEDKYGMTIGQFALRTNNMFAIRKLLDRGLNPNLIDKSGNSIVIDINNSAYSHLQESLETLKYLIKRGANVNLYSEKGQLHTPLIAAVNSNFENVKVLVEAGADVNFIDKFYKGPFRSPLSAALLNRNMEITNYLIFDKKVDFRTLKYPIDSKFHPGEYVILHELRKKTFDLNTKDYQEKMKLVAYLKTQGLDYWKTPIPDNIKNNPNFTQEYLSKY